MAYFESAPQGAAFTTLTSASFIPEHWSLEVIRERDNNLTMKSGVTDMSFIGKKGDTIKLPYIHSLGVNDKVSGAPVQYQSNTEPMWQMIIDRYKESSFSVEDITDIQSQQNHRSIYTERAGFALAQDIDNAILAERATIKGYNSQSNYVDGGADSLTYADILAAFEVLNVNNVPREGRMLFIGPRQEAALLGTSSTLIDRNYTGDVASIAKGYIGNILGMPVIVTSAIGINSTTGYTNGYGAAAEPTPGVTSSRYYPTQPGLEANNTSTINPSALTTGKTSALMVHKDWCRLAMQKMPKVDADWSTDYQEWHIVQSQIYGVKVFRPDHAVVIDSTES